MATALGIVPADVAAPAFRPYGPRDLDAITQRFGIAPDLARDMRAVAEVLPFRTNEYVLQTLVDWSHAPDDPLFRLTFPSPDMLEPADLEAMRDALHRDAPRTERMAIAGAIRRRLNPHPGGQLELNRPRGETDSHGIQHKYRDTVLLFPSPGQTCHAYCSYCFRWAQFVAEPDWRFAEPDPAVPRAYIAAHPEVGDVILTGGDPLVMSTAQLRRHIVPLLDLASVRTIRIGTKSLAYWPYRFLAEEADELLRLFEEVIARGKRLVVMAHFSHPRELEAPLAQRAVRRVLETGAGIYCQAPLVGAINDAPEIWSELWRGELALGCVPYYMFVERDTGAVRAFRVPLVRALEIFTAAYRELPGLARTVRGPVMSATPGKVVVDGIGTLGRQEVFVLRFLRARDEALTGRSFFARLDPEACWLSELEPVPGAERFPWREA
jgi:L-lysine 2,3-aminomutase